MTTTTSRGARARGATSTLLLALVVAALVLVGTVGPGTTAAAVPAVPAHVAADETPAPEGEVAVEITSVSPAVLEPGGTLSVGARITNGTATTLESPTTALGVDGRALSTRSALENWAATDLAGRVGARVTTQDLAPVAPGATADVTFAVTAAELGLTARSDWGPRGLSLTVSDAGSRQAVERTFVLWAPSDDVTPVRLSIVAAVTGPPVDPDPEAYSDALSTATGPDGRLGHLLEATSDRSGVAWVVDPALVAAASSAPDPAVDEWADDLLAASAGRSTFALRAYDPDVAAFAHADLPLPEGTPLPGADPEPADQTTPSPTSTWRTDLAWPADPVPDVATTALAAASGATSVLVGGDALAPDDALTYTPSGVAEVSTAAGVVTALVPDPVLTTLVAAGDASGAGATQRLLAETAFLARERPAESRHVLVALPRSWDPDPAAFSARLDALDAAAWVALAPLDELLTTPAPDVARTPLPDETPATDEVPAAQLRALDRSRSDVAAFATVAADPAAITRPLEPGFVAPTAIAFRSSPDARTIAVQHAQQDADAVRASIAVQRGSTFLFVAEQESLPVRVTSTLEQDATVQVVLRPDDPRLKAPQRPTVTVPAATRDADGRLVASEATVDVPVEGFGSGNVTVEVELLSAAQPQVRVAQPEEFVVRVRADWESVGTAVVAALLGLAFVAGIWRTVRRGRSPRRVPGATLEQPTVPPPAAPATSPTTSRDRTAARPADEGRDR